MFLDDGVDVCSVALDALPIPSGPVALAGDAAVAVVSRLAARGADVMLLPARRPSSAGIAKAAEAGGAAVPLYVDPVEARPGAPARPAPPMIAAAPAHAAALAAIYAAAFSSGAQWGVDAMGLQLGLPGAFGLIDPAGGLVLARVAGDEAEILTLAVAPEVRRRGLATRLLAAAMAEAARRHAASMVLEVGARNGAAQALYARAGFVPVGRRPRYYAGGEDALILRAALCG